MSDKGRKNEKKVADPKDHMANERTFLAWIRTSIGIMAFGFVVEKFTLFIKQLALILGATHSTPFSQTTSIRGYSSIFGISLVALGGVIGLFAFVKYKQIERQLDEHSYQASTMLPMTLTVTLLLIGVFLVIYLSGSF